MQILTVIRVRKVYLGDKNMTLLPLLRVSVRNTDERIRCPPPALRAIVPGAAIYPWDLGNVPRLLTQQPPCSADAEKYFWQLGAARLAPIHQFQTFLARCSARILPLLLLRLAMGCPPPSSLANRPQTSPWLKAHARPVPPSAAPH